MKMTNEEIEISELKEKVKELEERINKLENPYSSMTKVDRYNYLVDHKKYYDVGYVGPVSKYNPEWENN